MEVRVVEEATDRSVSHLEERDWHPLDNSEGRGYMLADVDGRWFTYDDPVLTSHGLQVLPVVGTSYRKDALQHPAFAAGQRLILAAEPDNPHDRNAVGVWDADQTQQIGFLPRELAPPVSKSLLKGERLEVLSVWEWREPGGGPRRGIKILVGPVLPPIRPTRTLTLNLRIDGATLGIKGKTDVAAGTEIHWRVEHVDSPEHAYDGTVTARGGSYGAELDLSAWPHGRISVSVEVDDDEGQWSLDREEEIRWGAIDVEDLVRPVDQAGGEREISRMVDRNLLGLEMEKAGQLETAIALYEANIRDGFEGNGPYDRLAIIYRRQKQVDEEIRVLERAIKVFSAYKGPRTDVAPKLQAFRDRLGKARRMINKD